jgi:hypothetical protein
VDVDKVPAQKASADQARGVEANSAERKRSEARKETRKIGEQKIAEQQRKQRELEVATVAVRRIIHDRDAPDIRDAQDIVEVDQPEAPPPEMPHFRLFGR